ncbi:FISUMP domain-containing protein [Sphingobacterium rhinopitheci]|uniref:FISUMP domain-containing protein n=1 Tax=Sphingobacterium rhinopitheci TaxID=2781960 RepID=UPI001F51A52B|nr:FISUMP domain-containing protein [Sphingobacterium rhinopitheci]MCI0922610.1 hypothetical protein [Sphingobacterium rhinopitheci]
MKTNYNFILIFKYVSFLFSFCFLFSCAKDSKLNINEKRSVVINVSSALANTEYEGNIINGKSASITSNSTTRANISTISLNKDYYLEAVISPSKPTKAVSNKIKKDNSPIYSAINKATTSPFTPGFIYRLLVYNKNTGDFVTQREYISGSEDEEDALKLDGGVTYTFVAYSVSSSSATLLPTAPEVNISSAAINLVTSNLGASNQFLFFKKDLTISGEAVEYLNIIFKPQFTEINVTINAEATGYNIETVGANLNVETSDFSFSFQSENITNTGGNVLTTNTLNFPALSTEEVTSTSIFIKPQSVTSLLTLTSLKIGNITVTYPSAGLTPLLTDVDLLPGKKYTIALTVVPEDRFYVENGQLVASINGQVWMRRNVGADASVPEDVDIYSAGNYYQWGQNTYTSFRDGLATSAPATWIDNSALNASFTSWNAGTELSPKKNVANDPCPNYFRIPTQTEYNTLMDNTIQSPVGTTGNAGFGNTFRSKRNAEVVLTFQVQGWFNIENNTATTEVDDYIFLPVSHKLEWLCYWTSTRQALDEISFLYFTGNDNSSAYITASPSNGTALISMPVRCISTANDQP